MATRATPKAMTAVPEHGEKSASDESATTMRFAASQGVSARVCGSRTFGRAVGSVIP